MHQNLHHIGLSAWQNCSLDAKALHLNTVSATWVQRPVQVLNAQALALLMQEAKLRKGMLGAAASRSAGEWLKDDQHLDDLVRTE